jgi:hypothetical protein
MIYVATHKEAIIPKANFYIPIGLGRKELIRNVSLYDNTPDDNIGYLNNYFCELTATYWIFKHSPLPVVGLCHYRRYFNLLPNIQPNLSAFSTEATEEALRILSHPEQERIANDILDHYDIIVPRAGYCAHGIARDYISAHRHEEWHCFIDELDLLYGPTSHSMNYERRFFFGNMLICKRELFNRYAVDLFSLLFNVFKKVGIPAHVDGKRYQDYRYPGYLGERFTSAFINHYRLKYFESQTIHFS